MTSQEYFYFEWLIVEKNMTQEKYSALSEKEIADLMKEYNKFVSKLK